MTEPQVWTMIVAFTGVMVGTLTVISTLFVRVLRSEIGGLRGEIGGLRGEMNARFDAVNSEMNARFDAVSTRLDYLDRDVQALTKRVWGDPG